MNSFGGYYNRNLELCHRIKLLFQSSQLTIETLIIHFEMNIALVINYCIDIL